MEADDLVVLEVRRDVGACRRLAGEADDVVAADAVAIEPGRVGVEVVPADRGEHDWVRTEQPQVVGDVRRAAAEAAPQLWDVEGDVQHVDAIGQDHVTETAAIDHDVVHGHGSRAQHRHAPTASDREGGSLGRCVLPGQWRRA